MAQTRRAGLIAQAVVCLGLVVWQGYDLATAGTFAPISIALFDIVILICAAIGLVGAVSGLRRSSQSQG